jgi:hypothetical protein
MSEEQEPFETLMRKMCDSVLRDMQPQVVEAEQAAKQARAELRDRFAGHALEGLLAAGDAHAYNRDEMAAEAWRQADAMMKAREENSQ